MRVSETAAIQSERKIHEVPRGFRCPFIRIQAYYDGPTLAWRYGRHRFRSKILTQWATLSRNLYFPYFFTGDAAFHRRISVPTLLIYGLKDPFVSLVEMCEMERTIPKAYLELLPLAGHMSMLEQPKQLNIMMKKFIEKYWQPWRETFATSLFKKSFFPNQKERWRPGWFFSLPKQLLLWHSTLPLSASLQKKYRDNSDINCVRY